MERANYRTPRLGHIVAAATALLLAGCGGGLGDETAADARESLLGRRTAVQPALRSAETPQVNNAETVPATTSRSTLLPVSTTAALTAPTASPPPIVSLTPTADIAAANTPNLIQTAATAGTNSSTCGADVGGWTQLVPSPVDPKINATDLKQPGSRLIYISSSSGKDTAGRIYFWNGSQIVDQDGRASDSSGQAYGIDPMNPSSAVKAYRRWAYVGPRANGGDIGSPGLVGNATPSTRYGYPDWWLFKRADTFDLTQDLLSFERETNPGATSVNSSLAVPGGRSATERQVVGAYGSPCLTRPRFIHPLLGFVSRFANSYTPSFKNVVYTSLHFDGNDRPTGETPSGIVLRTQDATSTNILFEDIWIDAAVSDIQHGSASVTIRRSLITDAYGPNGAVGLYYEGKRDSILKIEESILLRNGFRSNPKLFSWPPRGNNSWDMFSRNLYLAGETKNMDSIVSDTVSMAGGSGDQMRLGMRVERNFFYQGYVHMGAHGGYPTSGGATGTLRDNVLQRLMAVGATDNRGHPGWGLQLSSGAYGVAVTGNIVTGAQDDAPMFGMELDVLDWQCSGLTSNYATRGNTISGNYFDTGNAEGAIRIRDGLGPVSNSDCSSKWSFPGVTGNTVTNNTIVNKSGSVSQYLPRGGAIGTVSDTVFSNNKVFTTRGDAARALGMKDPNRTLKTYLNSKGIVVTSPDGFPEYYGLAINMRRGNWNPDLTAKQLVDYYRDGVGMISIK